jgi:hypothetical protein
MDVARRYLRSRDDMRETSIATRCILRRLFLFYNDRDFDPFVEHLRLRSAMAIPTGVN